MLLSAKELPPASSQRTFLDAGCGIALIPHLLAYWGFRVIAVDLCADAIKSVTDKSPSEECFARCVPIWERYPPDSNSFQLMDDPGRSIERLRSFQSSGGSLKYLACDWFSDELLPNSFTIVYCRNSLRGSGKTYWRRSLARFSELLLPGGLLLLENINAFWIQDEVAKLLLEMGFVATLPEDGRNPSVKYVISMWPTG